MKAESDLLYTISKWCLYLMNATAASLESAEKSEEEIQTLLSVWFYRPPIFPENALGSETTASVFGRNCIRM